MKLKYLNVALYVALLLVGVAGAQGPAQSSVNHGVTPKYEQPDDFPVHETHTVEVGNGTPYYDPPELTVTVGDVVKWANKQLSDTHTIIDKRGHFESTPVPAKKNWCYHFIQEGDYEYSCRFHPWMKGVVHVRRQELPVTGLDSARTSAVTAERPTKSVEDGMGGYWIAGLRPGTLIYHPALKKNQIVTVSGTNHLVLPIGATTTQLLVTSGGSLASLDLATRKVADRVALPKGFLPIQASPLSDAEFWMTNVEGTTLALVNMKGQTVRLRPLPAGSRVISIRERHSRVWALDAGRQLLLLLGPEWINETPLPHDVRNANSLIIDADGQPWFLDSVNGVAGVLLNRGIIQSFSIPNKQGAELMTLAGAEGIMLRGQHGEISKINLTTAQLVTNLPSDCSGGPTAADTNQTQSSEARNAIRH